MNAYTTTKVTRKYSISEVQAPQAVSRPRGNGHVGYINYCPHCDDQSTKNELHMLLAERGYHERTGLYRCGKCSGKYTLCG